MQDKEPFDVVILDLTVPGGMGGRETLKKMREIDPSVVAIVSSGYASDTAMSEYRRFRFTDIIANPYTLNEFREAMIRVMRNLDKS